MTVAAGENETGVTYNAHAIQLRYHSDKHANRWFCAGYGTGKTTTGVIDAFANATINHPGYVGIVAAPSYPLLMQAWFAEWCQWIPREWWKLHRDPKKGDEIQLRTREGFTSTILLRSTSNPWSNEGVNAAWLVFDEAPRERNQESHNVLRARLRRGYPGRQITSMLTGPPQSKQHWSAKEYGFGPSNGFSGTYNHWHSQDTAVIRARTSDNPYLPKDYERKLRSRPGASAAWCKQYIDAEFGALEGQVYSAFSRDVHVIPARKLAGMFPPNQFGKLPFKSVECGIDWGWEHPGVMIVGAITGLGDIYILAEESHQYKPISDSPDGWFPIAQKLLRTWKIRRWYGDPSQPQALFSLQRAVRGTNVYPADNDRGEGIRRITARFDWALARYNRETAIVAPGAYRPSMAVPLLGEQSGPGLYISDDCPNLIGKLEVYSRKKHADGSMSEDPEKKNDDEADALRYLVMGLTGEDD